MRVCLLAGSGRINSNGAGLCAWVRASLARKLPTNCEIITVTPQNPPHPRTPVTDPAMPATVSKASDYGTAEAREWATFITTCQALVIVTPEYNYGYPSSVKNALDVIYGEWKDKPAALVTYGGGGGRSCGEQLRKVMINALKMKLVEEHVEVRLPRDFMGGTTRVQPEDAALEVLEGTEAQATDNTAAFLLPYKPNLEKAIDELYSLISAAEK
eukprot:TRINITY_DN33107_c0_g1_i1.p1 TRINITY_DN33107_c0_g1~~TRINITY_DN33107_c0_g1_i1.p1  ORF type:complete len:214 (-),score=23.90 TRINITY_DN33107_c0_g1_i1:447-1088(-)